MNRIDELEKQVADLKESLRHALAEADYWCFEASGTEIEKDEINLARERAK